MIWFDYTISEGDDATYSERMILLAPGLDAASASYLFSKI
jgi:hypothetical protein